MSCSDAGVNENENLTGFYRRAVGFPTWGISRGGHCFEMLSVRARFPFGVVLFLIFVTTTVLGASRQAQTEVPWFGQAGITESVSEIMDRDQIERGFARPVPLTALTPAEV